MISQGGVAKLPRVRQRLYSSLLLGLLLVGGLLLRVHQVGTLPLWADEAESALNALTILRDRVPNRDYLNIPLFENTLLQPSPDDPEYEFTDISYSPDGFVLYHGWLPLYAIASSFRLFGIGPDEPGGPLVPRFGSHARHLRTVAARAPSLLFGMVTLVVLFYAGSDLFGWRAGLLATTLAAFSNGIIFLQQQARYYSMAVMISLLGGWVVWRMVRRGAWSDYALAGVALAALFYTHILSFVTLCIIAGCYGLGVRERPQKYSKLSLLAGIVLACCGPWLLITGYLVHAAYIPAAREMFALSDLVWVATSEHALVPAICAVGILVLNWRSRFTLIQRLQESARPLFPALTFVIAWLVSGYAVFLLGIPAPSLFSNRLMAMILAPALLLSGILLALAVRTIADRTPFIFALLLVLLLMLIANKWWPGPTRADAALALANIDAAVDYLARARLEPDTKIYASPSEHLILTFYTGLPVQSIAPVRRSFLNSYPGPIVFLERVVFSPRENNPAALNRIICEGKQAGYQFGDNEAREISWQIAWTRPRSWLEGRVAAIEPPAASLPPFAIPLVEKQMAVAEAREANVEAYHRHHPLFRGFRIRTAHDLWTVYFYRFVDPGARREHLPYAERLRTSTASLLRADWIAYRSPAPRNRTLPAI